MKRSLFGLRGGKGGALPPPEKRGEREWVAFRLAESDVVRLAIAAMRSRLQLDDAIGLTGIGTRETRELLHAIARYRAAGDKWAAAVSTGGSVVWSPEKAAARDPGGADIGCMFYGSNDGACHASERERAIVCRAPDKICDRAACLAPLLDDHTRPTVAP